MHYLELTSDGNLLSCSSDETVKLWQKETGQLLDSIQFEHNVFCFKILNEDLLAVGCNNGQIQIYNLNNKETIITIPAHKSSVNELLLLKNGCLISQSNDYKIMEIKKWKILDDN